MKIAAIIIVLAVCSVCASEKASVINAKLLLQDANGMIIDKPEWIVINRARQFTNQIFTTKSRCSRYCIDNLNDYRDFQNNKLHLIWHISQDSVGFTKNSNNVNDDASTDPKGSRKTDLCEIQLSIGCSNVTNLETKKSNGQLKILEKSNLSNDTTSTFNVHQRIEALEVKIAGSITWLFLEIPTDERRDRPLNVSLSRDNQKNQVNLVIDNPPSGGWQLKLRGWENSTYHLAVSQILKTTVDSPSSVPSLDRSDKETDKGVVMYLEGRETVETRRASLTFPDDITSYEDSQGVRRRPNELRESLEDLSRVQAEDRDYELGALSRTSGLTTRGKSLPVDLASETTLLAKPGNIHPVVFLVTNNQFFNIFHTFQARSTQFQLVDVRPPGLWIRPGGTIRVIVNIAVPMLDDNTVDTVTLYVERSQNLKAVEKSAYVYLQSTSNIVSDSTKPTINYEFSNNCAGRLRQERCENSVWSVEITVTDADSGLKRVTSQPTGVQPKQEFIAGTKNPLNFLYSSTCCYTTVEVTATDVVGNTYTRTIDVTAWDNLTTGEIAAIVLGSILLLLIIVLLILLCVYCVRKRKSADISYSQRYGSRTSPTARVERTSF